MDAAKYVNDYVTYTIYFPASPGRLSKVNRYQTNYLPTKEQHMDMTADGLSYWQTEEQLREYCTGRISHQKIPRYFQFVESYPMTASGKMQKFALRAQAIQTLGLEEVAQMKTA